MITVLSIALITAKQTGAGNRMIWLKSPQTVTCRSTSCLKTTITFFFIALRKDHRHQIQDSVSPTGAICGLFEPLASRDLFSLFQLQDTIPAYPTSYFSLLAVSPCCLVFAVTELSVLIQVQLKAKYRQHKRLMMPHHHPNKQATFLQHKCQK